MGSGFTNVKIVTFFLMTYILIYTSITAIPLFSQLPNYTGPGEYPALMHEYDLISAHATLLQVLTHHRVNIPHYMMSDFRTNTVYFYKSSFTDTSK